MRIRLQFLNNQFVLVFLHIVLLRLSYPPFHCGYLAWIAYVPLLFALPILRWRWLFLGAVLFQLSFIYWLAPLNILAYLFLVIVLASLDLLAVSIVKHRLFLFPIAFLAIEVLRVYFPYALPFQVIGYTQYLYPLVLGPAAIGKVWFISMLIYMFNYAVYRCLVTRSGKYFFVLISILMFCFFMSSLPISKPVETMRIGLIQPNQPMSVSAWKKNRGLFLAEYRTLTQAAVCQGATLVVWPETAMGLSLRNDRQLAKSLRSIIDQEKVALLIGNVDERLFSLRFKERYNSAFYIDKSGVVLGEHYKAKLIPFVETINYQLLLPWNIRNQIGSGEYLCGTKPASMSIQGYPVATIICFEAQFPEYVNVLAKNTALLINLSSDGWSHSQTEHELNFMVNVLRAVENRQCVVRVAEDGISAVISPQGKIIAKLPMGQRGVLVVNVPLVKTRIRTAPSVSVR